MCGLFSRRIVSTATARTARPRAGSTCACAGCCSKAANTARPSCRAKRRRACSTQKPATARCPRNKPSCRRHRSRPSADGLSRGPRQPAPSRTVPTNGSPVRSAVSGRFSRSKIRPCPAARPIRSTPSCCADWMPTDLVSRRKPANARSSGARRSTSPDCRPPRKRSRNFSPTKHRKPTTS